MTNAEESESDRTLWCGNVSEKITDELLYELFLQAGPLVSVKVPSDKEGRRRNFGFILFKHACSVPYAVKLLNGIRLHGRCLNLQYRPGSVHMTPPRTDSQNNDGRMPSPVGPGGVPMPMMDERGLPLLNGMPGMPGMGNFPSRMGPPLPMQPLMSPGGLNRSYSAPGMSPNDNSSWGGPRDGRDNRDRSRDGRDHSRDRNDRNDRGRDRFDRDDRGHRDNRNRDNRDYRGRDRGHRNPDRSQDRGQDRDYRNQSQDRNRNSSQDRKNDSGDMSMSRLRKGETFHNFSTPPSLMGSGPPSLMGSAPPGDTDHRRGSDSSRDSRDSRSQRNVPPWQQPY